VPRPTILLDKKTNDAHDNPVMNVDAEGYIHDDGQGLLEPRMNADDV